MQMPPTPMHRCWRITHIHELACLLGVGYPADRSLKPIRESNRRPFEEVVHHGHW
jgi:nitroreductase